MKQPERLLFCSAGVFDFLMGVLVCGVLRRVLAGLLGGVGMLVAIFWRTRVAADLRARMP